MFVFPKNKKYEKKCEKSENKNLQVLLDMMNNITD